MEQQITIKQEITIKTIPANTPTVAKHIDFEALSSLSVEEMISLLFRLAGYIEGMANNEFSSPERVETACELIDYINQKINGLPKH
jgi:hypothetical protein